MLNTKDTCKIDKTTIDTYSDNAEEFANRYESVSVSQQLKLFLKYLPAGGRILEIGCGSGRDAAFLLDQGFDVTAVDASNKLLSLAAKYHPQLQGKLYKASAPFSESYPFMNKKFDGAVSMAMIMHLSDASFSRFLSQLANLVKPNGILFLSSSAGRTGLNNKRDPKQRLYIERSLDSIAKFASREGFSLLHTHTDHDLFGRNISWHGIVFRR